MARAPRLGATCGLRDLAGNDKLSTEGKVDQAVGKAKAAIGQAQTAVGAAIEGAGKAVKR